MMRQPRPSQRTGSATGSRSFTAAALVQASAFLFLPAVLHAQEDDDRPDDGAQTAAEVQQEQEQVMLEDFGSGLRAFAALLDDTEIDIDELKEMYKTAQDALNPDYEMYIYVEGYEDGRQQQELSEFRDELTELVYNGSMTRDEVLGTWLEVMDVRFFHRFETDEVDWSDRMRDADGTGNLAPIRLRIPDAGDVRILVRPEFLMRDLQYFARELELDESTRAIVETLLRDYVETYERRAAELKEAIREARRSGVRESMLARASRASDTLARVSETMDWSGLQDRVDERVEGARRQEWMRSAVGRMEGSILGIRKAIDQRRIELEGRTGGPPDAGQVIRLAADLQSDRRSMRERMIEGMKLVLDDDQQEALDRVFDKFALDQGRIDSRLGGSRIDLELALREAYGDQRTTEEAREAVSQANAEVLRLLNSWTDTRMQRERAGLELFVAFQRDDESAIEKLTTTIGQRARTELAAAIAIRDRLLTGRSEVAAIIEASDPVVAERFTGIARAQGFAPQVRTRWCEQALAAASACTDLEEAQRTAIEVLASGLEERLEPIRVQAIEARLQSEPRIARSGIDRMLGRSGGAGMDIDDWREPGARRFRDLDEQLEEQLEALLAETGCLDTLPPRRGRARPRKQDQTR